ncbi:MAG: hypothetical protein M3515_04740 [Actinomycetota bacterium]|nr:hypothetical protein [Actinomycetota bacterium]
MLDLDAALRHLIQSGGSDLHLKVPSPPMIRVSGRLEPLPDAEALRPDVTRSIIDNLLVGKEAQRAEFEAENEVDLAFAVSGLARFRVNAFQQRGSVSLVMRAIPHEIKTVEQLQLRSASSPTRSGGSSSSPGPPAPASPPRSRP